MLGLLEFLSYLLSGRSRRVNVDSGSIACSFAASSVSMLPPQLSSAEIRTGLSYEQWVGLEFFVRLLVLGPAMHSSGSSLMTLVAYVLAEQVIVSELDRVHV